MAIEIDMPQSREEALLATIAGLTGFDIEEPQSRIEKLLYHIIENGSMTSEGFPIIIDEVTSKQYRLGCRNGELYAKEVDANG